MTDYSLKFKDFKIYLHRNKSCRPFLLLTMQGRLDADMNYNFFSNFLFKGFLTIITVISGSVSTFGGITQKEADNRANALKHASTSSDSVKILLDVLDLSDKVNKDRVRLQIIDVVQRTEDSTMLADVINELAASTDDTQELAKLIEISGNIPEDDGKKSVETVLQMEQASAEAKAAGQSDIQDKIVEYTRTGMVFAEDPYEEIQNIYRALVFLGTSSMGPMYLEYITRLGELVDKLPEKDHAIKNLYYTTAAIFYTRKRDYEKAIEADKKLLNELQRMQKHYEKNGLDNHNLDYFYYISYRRMLRNFKGLTPEEIEEIYKKCVQLAQENEKVKEEFGNVGLANSYYYVATGKFDKAVPELKKALAAPNISDFRRQELTGLLAWALNETGNHTEELEVLRDFTMMAAADQEKRRDDTYREIEIRNTVNKMLAEEYKEQEKSRSGYRVMRKTSLTLVYVLAVILIFLCRAYFKLRQKVKLLETGNRKLRTNIEQIIDDGMPMGTRDLRKNKDRLKG